MKYKRLLRQHDWNRKPYRRGVIDAEGNNGGDYLRIKTLPGGLLRLEVGHCCVVAMKHVVPVEWLTSLIATDIVGADFNVAGVLDNVSWPAVYIAKLKGQVTSLDGSQG